MNSAPKLSKSILTMRKPSCKSALNTISAVPPSLHPFTTQEQQLLKNLNKNIFKIVTSINIKMLERLTRDYPNRPFIDYILNGLQNGFRYGYMSHRRRVIQDNLESVHLDISAFEKAIKREVDLG